MQRIESMIETLEQWADQFRELIQTLDRLPTLARELASVPTDGSLTDRRRILGGLVDAVGLAGLGLGDHPAASAAAAARLMERAQAVLRHVERDLPLLTAALAGAMVRQPGVIATAGVRLRWFVTTDDNPKQFACVAVADAPDSLRRAVASL